MGVRMAGVRGNGWKDGSRNSGHPRRRRMAKGCKRNDGNFIVIDVDSDNFDSVVEIEAPEYVGTELRGSGVPVVISIDDDDDDEVDRDEERDYADHPAGDPECDSEGRSSESSPPASDDMQNGLNSGDSDDCWVFEAKGPAFNSSRWTDANAAEGLSSNHCGWDCKLETDSSDCEILEGSSEDLREEWEKALSRRKSRQGQSGVSDQASPSSSGSRSDAGCGVGSSRKGNVEAPESLNSKNLNNNENFGSFGFDCKDDGLEGGGGSANHNMEDGFSKSDPKCKEVRSSIGLNPKSREKTAMNEEDNAYFTRENSYEYSSLSERNEPLGNYLDQTERQKEMDQSCTPPGIRTDGASRDIINDREKLKETDEYKQAVEEEWLARQQQLQIQAEEAQRLRKRRKAERSRTLDMEKRQKQRLDEIRETQKKDENHLNMKDQIRGEIRKELRMLEMTCFDMSSLLRRLGIPVGFYPLSNEVHAAYKRALLKFHPDRVSRSDIREQVEAEERFKLISRMKEKFLSPS